MAHSKNLSPPEINKAKFDTFYRAVSKMGLPRPFWFEERFTWIKNPVVRRALHLAMEGKTEAEIVRMSRELSANAKTNAKSYQVDAPEVANG